MLPTKPSAFTLIELLIVVAIIAILAAIAVPNFLEAQTRSKVSRTRADMRTVATGLESYFVDHNRYPPDFTDVLLGNAVINAPIYRNYRTLIGRLSHLTTPIAYLSSLPTDVFAGTIARGNFPETTAYRENASAAGAIINPIVFDYAKFDRSGIPDSVEVWDEITNNPANVQWALNSPGPDVTLFDFLGFSTLVVYDPTNGTISPGNIIRTNVSAEDQPSE